MYAPTRKYYRALDMAVSAHRGQKRSNFKNYVCHPIEVANVLIQMGIEDENLIIAALLHDVIEDCSHRVNMNDILAGFGIHVCRLVASATDDNRLNRTQQKNAQVKAMETKAIDELILKLADRYCNVMGLVSKQPISIAYTDHTEEMLKAVVERKDEPDASGMEHVTELYMRIYSRIQQVKVGVV